MSEGSEGQDGAVSRWAVLREVGSMAANAAKLAVYPVFVSGMLALAMGVVITADQYAMPVVEPWLESVVSWLANPPDLISQILQIAWYIFIAVLWVILVGSVWFEAKRRVRERDADA